MLQKDATGAEHFVLFIHLFIYLVAGSNVKKTMSANKIGLLI